ncbi:transcription factor S [Candidatus Woesearchaeota archaeon]|nr:transcription factor S [Candidatus Woesearchaeota archaeon]
MIQFCPKCKSILRPKKEDGKVIMFCSCGHTSKASGGTLKEDSKVKKDEAEIAVVDKEVETLPKTKAECPQCGNDEAYYWTHQTRAGDEAETKFLKCTKCKKTWRDYD